MHGTKARLITLLDSHPFKVAKTMPHIPHAYTLKQHWACLDDFEFAVQAIRDLGTVEIFFSKPYTYFYNSGFKYWTMGAPISETILINRAMDIGRSD